MAFFGLTNLGYQHPIRDKMIVAQRGPPQAPDGGMKSRSGLSLPLERLQGPLRCTDMCSVYNQPLPHSSDIHHGSQKLYKDMVRRGGTPRSPSQLYVMPLTDSQQYGWLISKDKSPESWTQTKRFPLKESEMTKFVKQMSMTDREFSLF